MRAYLQKRLHKHRRKLNPRPKLECKPNAFAHAIIMIFLWAKDFGAQSVIVPLIEAYLPPSRNK